MWEYDCSLKPDRVFLVSSWQQLKSSIILTFSFVCGSSSQIYSELCVISEGFKASLFLSHCNWEQSEDWASTPNGPHICKRFFSQVLQFTTIQTQNIEMVGSSRNVEEEEMNIFNRLQGKSYKIWQKAGVYLRIFDSTWNHSRFHRLWRKFSRARSKLKNRYSFLISFLQTQHIHLYSHSQHRPVQHLKDTLFPVQ